jgi:hypothetical protein
VCRRSCTRRVGLPIATNSFRQCVDSFQFSSPNSAPLGDVTAGPALESPADSLLEDRHHWLRYGDRPTTGRRLRVSFGQLAADLSVRP